MNYCHSCSMPLAGEAAENARGNLCQYCSDENGNLVPREQAVQGIAAWLRSWAPEASDEMFLKRANSFLDAMPAWQ